MSILTELSRLQTAKANMKTALESKEVVVPSDARLSDYPALITSIRLQVLRNFPKLPTTAPMKCLLPLMGGTGRLQR